MSEIKRFKSLGMIKDKSGFDAATKQSVTLVGEKLSPMKYRQYQNAFINISMRIATQEFGENEKFRKLQTATYSYETSVFNPQERD